MIQIQDFSFTYKSGETPALREIGLTVPDGGFLFRFAGDGNDFDAMTEDSFDLLQLQLHSRSVRHQHIGLREVAVRRVDQRAHRRHVSFVAARDQRRAQLRQPLRLCLVARYGQESNRHQCRMGQHHRMGLRHVVEPDVRDRSEPCRVFQYDAGVRGVQMHMERIAAPLDDDEKAQLVLMLSRIIKSELEKKRV